MVVEHISRAPEDTVAKETAEKEAVTQSCQKECGALSQEVESQQKFLAYAKNFEKEFGSENIPTVAQVLIENEYTLKELASTPKVEILEDLRFDIKNAIKEKKKAELAQEDENLDSGITELAHSIKKRKENIEQLNTKAVVLTKEVEALDAQLANLTAKEKALKVIKKAMQPD